MGYSPSIRIPANVMQVAALNIDDKLELTIDNSGQIILVPLKFQQFSLEVLLSSITQDNIHEKINLGLTVGRELI